ncbi:hypothetical protein F5876DRAFT_81281 [Lentinula aff. lateritia]|uniref:Uncharacterized protein n=1 Tax=Lentinula aff. lateritia TaxID=2804960 RepID=A0ACC1TMD0_9AGAR|nr:hypothetical protein F5876DRAFT_81281 [Lentinula aff. lateritia]
MDSLAKQEVFIKFPDIEKLAVASSFLHAYLAPEVREKLSVEICATILSADPTFHEKLKEAHRSQNSEELENLCIYLKQNAWRFHPHLQEMNRLIRTIYSDGRIAPIARGEWKRPSWMSKSNDAHTEITAHMESLDIPVGTQNVAVPLIVLYELGSFQHHAKLRGRLDRIFSSSNHTFLVNTSGTGKTRLLLEGLCFHWGFYLTCAIDASSLGAADFPSVLNDVNWDHSTWTSCLPPISDSNHPSLLQGNRRLVYRAVSEALFARFIVFKMFLEVCSKQGFCPEQRQRWLELQIFPTNITPSYDSFSMIKSEITRACLSDEELDEAMLHLMEEIQSIWEMPGGDFFYIAVDEVNVASRMHEEAFEDQRGRYPILKEILRSLRRRMGQLPVKFVVSGTIIPEDHFQSTIGEWDDFRWCSETGSFNDPDEHRRYITKFLPPKFAISVPGQALLDRMWQWLRGRHRYTASFLAVLLYNNFHSPHTLLGNYIENITEYLPYDNEKYSEGEEGRYNDWYLPLGHRGLGLWSLNTVTVEMHRAATSFLSTATGCIDCLTEDRVLITEDYGYFIDPDCAQIALNEPITVTAGAIWLKKNFYFGFAKFIRIFCKISEVVVDPTHFAHFLAFWLTSISGPSCEIPDTYRSFRSPTVIPNPCKISDAFRIIGLPALPEVKLVTFTKIEQRFEAVDVHLREDIYGKLVFMASSNEDILSWFKHERDEPFCALMSSSSNTVILVFCLQRADEQSFWVFVRISAQSTNEEDIDFGQEIDDLHPTKVFHDQPDILPLLSNLPNLCLEVGAFGVLRISGSSWAENASEDNIPPEQRPAGVLNIDGLDEAEKGVPYEEFMRRLSQAIVQTKKKVETALPPPVVEDSKKGKKRGRSSTVIEEDSSTTPTIARTRKTKSARSTRGDVSNRRAASTRRTKSLKSTNANVTTGSDNKPGRSNDRQVTARILPSRRSPGRISDVASGRVSSGVTRPDRVEPTGSTSSTPYNLRKR